MSSGGGRREIWLVGIRLRLCENARVAPSFKIIALLLLAAAWPAIATAIGNKLAGVIGGLWDRIPLEGIFWINCLTAVFAAGAIAMMVPRIRRVMVEHEKRSRT